jgi:hypothetical protein
MPGHCIPLLLTRRPSRLRTILQRAEVRGQEARGYGAHPAWRISEPLKCCQFVYHTTHDELEGIGYFRQVRQRVHSTPRLCAQARKGSSNDAQTFRLSVRLTFGSE